MMHHKSKRLIFPLIIFLFIITGLSSCGKEASRENAAKNFDTFMNHLFIQEVKEDSLSLNYSLAHPENYGINETNPTLGDYGIRSMKESLSVSENYLSRLLSLPYSSLDKNRQLTYHIVKNYLEEDLAFGNYMYYSECLGPTTGIQAQLPILLAEYSFYEKEDIETYLALLACVDDYFDDIIQYERDKSAHGLFMNDNVAEHIIEQCKSFLQSPQDNFLVRSFDERISQFKGLTDQETAYYKAQNRAAVFDYVILAYQKLISALKDLKGTGKNPAGLYYYPEGQSYYECLAQYKTGSGKSMDEMIHMLDQALGDGVAQLTTLTQTNPSVIDKYLSFTSFPITNPQDIINDLKADMQKDFPKAVPVECKIKYVPDSLADYLSPAMYLVPPIDHYSENNIYINGDSPETLATIYTTVAHEGYPGHLYQCVYFRSHNPAPIRNILNFTGYDEGWATYVEFYSYHFAGIDEDLADFLEKNNMVILCMYARADIGVHYAGWTRDEVVNFINQYISNEEVASSIYDTLLEEPGIYLPYAIGYLEIMDLKKEAEQQLEDRFNAKAFHKFLLDIGPSQFDIIEKSMNTWIKNQ